jgi:RNA polymerase sigma-70 factor (ECF subfamily)
MAAKPQKDTSLTLLERVQKLPADLEAWDEFVRSYHPMIRGWCVKWGLQASDADDVARNEFEKGLESLFDRDLFAIAMRRVEKRVKPVTWDAFRLTALEGLTGQDAARRVGIPVAHVFVARNRVQKLLQEEIRIMKGDGG